jgi:hypothetical protein
MDPIACPSCGLMLRTHGRFDDDGEVYDAGPLPPDKPVVCIACLAVIVVEGSNVRALTALDVETLPLDLRKTIEETRAIASAIAMKSEA